MSQTPRLILTAKHAVTPGVAVSIWAACTKRACRYGSGAEANRNDRYTKHRRDQFLHFVSFSVQLAANEQAVGITRLKA
jgi:hypothetical protein